MDRPVPGEGLPAGWRPIEWLAFSLLHGGATIRQAAKEVDRAPSTVTSWLKKWRARFGADVIILREPSSNLKDPAVRAKGVAASIEAHRARHLENREQMALAAGVTADHVRALAMKIVQELAKSPSAIRDMTTKDVLNLARAFDLMSRRADLLDDIVPSDRGLTFQQNNGGQVLNAGGVDLSALELQSSGDSYRGVLDAVELVWSEFVVDVTEVVPDGDA